MFGDYMVNSALVRIDGKTYAVLTSASKRSGISRARLVARAFGSPSKVKKVCEY